MRLKWRPARQQGKHHAAHAIEIAGVGDDSTVVTSHVFGRADQAAVGRQPGVAKEPRDAEIRKLQLAVAG